MQIVAARTCFGILALVLFLSLSNAFQQHFSSKLVASARSPRTSSLQLRALDTSQGPQSSREMALGRGNALSLSVLSVLGVAAAALQPVFAAEDAAAEAPVALGPAPTDFGLKYKDYYADVAQQSFSLLYTSINVLAGHYTSYGLKFPVPEKRRRRLLQELADIEKAVKKRR
eukprot:gene25378-30645_t